MAGPLVSIAMPIRNCGFALRPAVQSLLRQTYHNWELLLLDDGSSDDALAVVPELADRRIRLVSDGRWRGISARLNQAIRLSRGEYFARMDGDDVAYPQRLERQLGYLTTYRDVHLVGAHMLVFGVSGRALGKRTPPEAHAPICARPFAGFPIAHPTFLGRIEWFHRHPYDESVRRCQDQELLLRTFHCSRFANVPSILHGYREARIRAGASIVGRWEFTVAVWRELRRRRQPQVALGASVEQLAKAGVDCVAAASRLHHRLLPHRARRLSDAERREWEEVWRTTNRSRA
jgi:glycosyltransferase involved in cell wall biosynthesis